MIRAILECIFAILIFYGFVVNLEEHRKFEKERIELNQKIAELEKQQRVLATDIVLCVKEK